MVGTSGTKTGRFGGWAATIPTPDTKYCRQYATEPTQHHKQ